MYCAMFLVAQFHRSGEISVNMGVEDGVGDIEVLDGVNPVCALTGHAVRMIVAKIDKHRTIFNSAVLCQVDDVDVSIRW